MVTSRVSVLAFRSRPPFAPSRHGCEENSNARCVEESREAADFADRQLTTGCRFTKWASHAPRRRTSGGCMLRLARSFRRRFYLKLVDRYKQLSDDAVCPSSALSRDKIALA
jgi:hypothetical protein